MRRGPVATGFLIQFFLSLLLSLPDALRVSLRDGVGWLRAQVPYRDMIVAVADKVQQMIAQGKSLEEVLAAKVTAPYAKTAGGTDTSAVRFVTAVYRELKSGGGR